MISHFLECKCLHCSIPLPRHPGPWHASDGISRFSSGILRWKSGDARQHAHREASCFQPVGCANRAPRKATSVCLMSPSSIWLLQKRSSTFKGKPQNRGCISDSLATQRSLLHFSPKYSITASSNVLDLLDHCVVAIVTTIDGWETSTQRSKETMCFG